MSNRKRVLVLGNDVNINNIDFDRLANDVITVGVNRIWLKHIPTYFFFHDPEILIELNRRPEIYDQLKRNSHIFCSDWLQIMLRKKKIGVKIPPQARVFKRVNPHQFVDSVSTAMQIFDKKYLSKYKCTFYIAGVSLKWMSPSHFWKTTHTTLNKKNESWYEPRFNRAYKNFEANIKNRGFSVISVTPKSRLNKLFRYIRVENLYE